MDKAQHILVFDFGKTNKKCLLFDYNFSVIDKKETRLPEMVDEDGFPCENIQLLTKWMQDTFNLFYQKYGDDIIAVNFSTYGASFVHLDINDKVILPLYNYLKPIKEGYFDKFYAKYGGKDDFSKVSASPALDFLNSGLQLLWLKQEKPHSFEQIQTSLHFPNYCSFLFNGQKRSEYTSLGCHTSLWDFEQMAYHEWVEEENILPKLAEIAWGTAIFPATNIPNLAVGIGLHDSSAALIPYLFGVKERFILISTGTWSITLNPFSTAVLTSAELKKDCLQFLRVAGKQVKASRLFLGNEFEKQLKKLNTFFDAKEDKYKAIVFHKKWYQNALQSGKRYFHFESLNEENKINASLKDLKSFEEAYTQLCYELVQKQVAAYHLAKGNTSHIETVFIDGGFSNNDVFCSILALELPNVTLKKTKLAAGSSLGAAIVMRPELFTTAQFQRILEVESL